MPKWSHERAAISYHDMHVPMHTNSHIYIVTQREPAGSVGRAGPGKLALARGPLPTLAILK